MLGGSMHVIPVFSTLVTFAFAFAVFRRYQYKHGPHLLMWTIGLIWYGLGTLSEVILGLAYSGMVLKIWYLSGAMLTAAWLGQGTVHLLVRRRGVAKWLTVILGFISLLAIVLVLSAPFAPMAPAYKLTQAISSQYKDILVRNGLTIALTIILNIYGTLMLVGGAVYSAFIFWRKHILMNRMLGNILIAAGALLPAMAGSFVKMGLVDGLYLSELLGVILMYFGFLQAIIVPVSATSSAAAD
jgi:hypothetical protein